MCVCTIPVDPLERGSDLASDSFGAGLADAAVRRHVGGEVAHGGVLGGEHVVAVGLRENARDCQFNLVCGASGLHVGNDDDFMVGRHGWHMRYEYDGMCANIAQIIFALYCVQQECI